VYTASSLTQWAFDNDKHNKDMAKRIQQKVATSTSATTTSTEPKQFHDTFIWGHSVGGDVAIQTAYPSSISGVILPWWLLVFPPPFSTFS
jgi:predicted esterase